MNKGQTSPVIPKYVQRLLERRTKLAMQLMDVGSELDNYCERIGITDLNSACLCSHVAIYCEPWNAQCVTEEAIKEALAEKNK